MDAVVLWTQRTRPTRTWKTAQHAVSHSAHTRVIRFTKDEKIKDRARRRQPPLHTKFLTLPGKKTNFYRDVHPLARLIDFRSGVAVGAIVTDKVGDVAELLSRIFTNRMEYRLDHHPSRPGFLKLFEKLTDSVVRLQTNDELITETFWNNYNNRTIRMVGYLAAGKEAERLRE